MKKDKEIEMSDLAKQILDVKKIEVNDNDVLIITFSNKNNDSDFLDKLMDIFSQAWKEKDVTCVFLPEDIKVNKASKEETIKNLEQIIEILKK